MPKQTSIPGVGKKLGRPKGSKNAPKEITHKKKVSKKKRTDTYKSQGQGRPTHTEEIRSIKMRLADLEKKQIKDFNHVSQRINFLQEKVDQILKELRLHLKESKGRKNYVPKGTWEKGKDGIFHFVLHTNKNFEDDDRRWWKFSWLWWALAAVVGAIVAIELSQYFIESADYFNNL